MCKSRSMASYPGNFMCLYCEYLHSGWQWHCQRNMGVELLSPTHGGQEAVRSESSVARCSPHDVSNAEHSISPQGTVITGGEILKVTFTA